MIKILIIVLAVIFLTYTEGMTMGRKPNYKEQIKEKFKNIDLSDGVDKEEAVIIAQNYMINEGKDFYKHYNILKPTVEDDSMFPKDWLASFSTTLRFRSKTGLKWNSMYINKKTGVVIYGGEGPC